MFAILGAVIGVVVGLAIGALLGYSVRRSATRDREAEAEQAAAKILVDAQAKEKETLLSAKEEAIQLRAQAEQESKARRDEVLRLEQRVANREETLDRKLDALERRETSFAEKEQRQEAIRAQLDELRKSKIAEVERVSGMTSQEARVLLLRELEDEIREEGNRLVRTVEAEVKEEADGRFHPTRIEEVVDKARQEVDASIKTAGEQAAIEAGCPGLHPEILKTLGRLKYRTSYGQNQIKHAVESAFIAAMIADEVGADVNVCRRGALLHDLGKAIDHEIEGTHAALGGELARRYNVSPAVVHCIEAHHEEIEVETTEAVIVQIADAISGSRPGARRETLELYIKRLEALEAIANGFTGVEKSFAIQAGREIRIMVKPDQIDDLAAMRLARDVSKKIEESLEYPGQIKVTVVRETRASEYAR